MKLKDLPIRLAPRARVQLHKIDILCKFYQIRLSIFCGEQINVWGIAYCLICLSKY